MKSQVNKYKNALLERLSPHCGSYVMRQCQIPICIVPVLI